METFEYERADRSMEEIDSFPSAKRARCRTIGWEDLHHDVLVSIAELLSVPDYVRFGAVCRTWATAAKAASISSYSHSPWLLFIPSSEQSHPTRLYLLDHPDRRYYHVVLPSNTTGVVGQKEGWIVLMLEGTEPFLLNPATGAELRLPSFASVFKDPYYNHVDVANVVLSAVPSSGSPYVALAVLAEPTPGLEHIYFARSDDHEWTELYDHLEATGEEEHDDDMITDAVYHQGKFFVLFDSGKLFAYDFSSGSTPTLSILVDKEEGYEYDATEKLLVSAPHGRDLLQVRLKRCRVLDRINYIWVMKFDPEMNKWAKVEDLGDSCLFIDQGHAMRLSLDIPDLQRNCIYFTDQFHDSRKQLTTFAAVYDLKKSSAKYWLPSKMRPICPSNTIPIWFVPSLL